MTTKCGNDLVAIAYDRLTNGEQAQCEDGGESEDGENQHGTFFPCSYMLQR
jgi:hypothetical protein